ncbi:hypothetical protein HGB24_00410 [Candidatus Saccharibacteria bacterium]|nr:hypothetical protein [Candidatus Saccharibacteria bacterium]
MKLNIIHSLKELIKDRYLFVLLIGMNLLMIALSITIGLSIHPSERQVISHYSVFGITHLYFDQWYYLFTFVVFGVILAILHSTIAIKMLLVKGHSLAVMFVWVSIGLLLFNWSTVSMVLNLRNML